MKKLVATKPGVAALVDYSDRPVSADEIKIEVQHASPKHGTEVVDFRGISPFMDQYFSDDWRIFMSREADEKPGVQFAELPLGNMVVGNIVEIGCDVTDFQIGDSVCSYGPIRETVIVKGKDNARVRKLPAKAKWRNAVCLDPAQFALSGLRDANFRTGDCVAIFGLGAIGQIAVQLAKKAGARIVVGIDPLSRRCQIARDMGADITMDPTNTDIGHELKKITDKIGVDVIIETSGHAMALQAALKGLAYGGVISYVAFGKDFPAGLNFGREAHFNNARIVFSRAASEPNPDHPRWNRNRIEETCWELLMNGYLECEKLISPIVAFSDSAEAFMHYVDRFPESSIKMGIDFVTNYEG